MSNITREEFARQFGRFLGKYDRFLLSGHIRPDGDSVGVCYALGYALRRMGKEVLICLDGDAKRYLELIEPLPLLPEDVPVQNAGKYFSTGSGYAFIMLDCSEPERTGRCQDAILYAQASMTVDHHITSKEAADFNYSEPQISSASELLYHLLNLCAIPVDEKMGTALFMGVAFDTGGLRHSSTSADTYAMVSELKKLGVDTTYLMNKLFHTKSLSEMKALSESVHASRLYKGKTAAGQPNNVLISYLSLQDMNKAGITAGDADGVVSYLNEISDAETAIFLREISPGVIRANMRSKSVVDVARVAALFGGGGHVRAAGCTFQEPVLLVKNALLDAVRRQIDSLEDAGE